MAHYTRLVAIQAAGFALASIALVSASASHHAAFAASGNQAVHATSDLDTMTLNAKRASLQVTKTGGDDDVRTSIFHHYPG